MSDSLLTQDPEMLNCLLKAIQQTGHQNDTHTGYDQINVHVPSEKVSIPSAHIKTASINEVDGIPVAQAVEIQDPMVEEAKERLQKCLQDFGYEAGGDKSRVGERGYIYILYTSHKNSGGKLGLKRQKPGVSFSIFAKEGEGKILESAVQNQLKGQKEKSS